MISPLLWPGIMVYTDSSEILHSYTILYSHSQQLVDNNSQMSWLNICWSAVCWLYDLYDCQFSMTIGTIMSPSTAKLITSGCVEPNREAGSNPRGLGLQLRVDHGAAWRRWPPASSNAVDPPGTVERALRSTNGPSLWPSCLGPVIFPATCWLGDQLAPATDGKW